MRVQCISSVLLDFCCLYPIRPAVELRDHVPQGENYRSQADLKARAFYPRARLWILFPFSCLLHFLIFLRPGRKRVSFCLARWDLVLGWVDDLFRCVVCVRDFCGLLRDRKTTWTSNQTTNPTHMLTRHKRVIAQWRIPISCTRAFPYAALNDWKGSNSHVLDAFCNGMEVSAGQTRDLRLDIGFGSPEFARSFPSVSSAMGLHGPVCAFGSESVWNIREAQTLFGKNDAKLPILWPLCPKDPCPAQKAVMKLRRTCCEKIQWHVSWVWDSPGVMPWKAIQTIDKGGVQHNQRNRKEITKKWIHGFLGKQPSNKFFCFRQCAEIHVMTLGARCGSKQRGLLPSKV